MKPTANLPRCTTCDKRAQSLFRSLTGSHLLKLDREQVAHEYQRGQIIFYEGNPPLAVHCVYSGTVKLYKTRSDGKRVVIRLLGPRELIGYRAVLAGENYAATAETVGKATICTISRGTFEELMRDNPEFASSVVSKLAVELRVSENQMVSRTQEPVRQRTARFLLWVLEGLQVDTSTDNQTTVPLLREEMAQLIGTTPETLSRVLRELADEKIVVIDRKRVSVSKPRILRSIAEG